MTSRTSRGMIRLGIFLCLGGMLRGAQEREPTAPQARWGHVFVYDPLRDAVLLFGGASERGRYRSETWIWDGSRWHALDVAGPSPRGFAAAAFHPRRGTVVIHGGRGEGNLTYSDTWEWDGAAWRQLEAESLHRVDHHSMVYLHDSGKLLAFGGWDGQDVTGTTWQWDGQSWTLLSQAGPRKRAAFAMAFHSGRGKVVLCGGLYVDGQYGDVWEWDDGWARLGGPYANSSLDHHAMVYDARSEQLVLFGGKNYRRSMLSDTQTLQDGRLRPLRADGPSPRHSLGLTYDSRRGRVILFGGKIYQGDAQLPLGDLWTWDGSHWTSIP